MSQYTLYRAYYKQRRPSGSIQSWQMVLPLTISYTDGSGHTTIISENSPQCGYEPQPEPQSRWVNVPINQDYECDTTTYTKYYRQKKQVSYNNGATWNDVSPAEYQRGGVYESQSIDCGYVAPNYRMEYLTFYAETDCTFSFSSITSARTYYSLDGGYTWETLQYNTNTPIIPAGSEIKWKGSLNPVYFSGQYYGIGAFSAEGYFKAYGNPMSMALNDNFRTGENLRDHQFKGLFSRCTGLTSAENLTLYHTVLAESCYRNMFYGCTSLTTPPALPATTLAGNCYYSMFFGCTSLTTAPELPATTLTNSCYGSMFGGCTNLTTAPELPAATLAGSCYRNMFNGCTSLTTPPALSATVLRSDCYREMFRGCTSLTTAPQLPAKTLDDWCYCDMFNGCTSLTTPPALPATALVQGCYDGMFAGCTSLTTAPQLPATTLPNYCYNGMFDGCTSLNSVTCLATGFGVTAIANWLRNVATNGTFTKAASMTSWPSGSSGIPNGWTVVDYA